MSDEPIKYSNFAFKKFMKIKNLKLISKYRTEIMGFAIIWVFLFHIFPYKQNYQYDFFKIISSYGYAGVDIFLFLSGFGLYHGFHKYNSKKSFYKKRFHRIIPTYLIFIILYFLFNKDFSLINFISIFFDLGWYFPSSKLPSYNWYMSFLMVLYILFPYYIGVFSKSPKRTTVFAIITSLSLTFILALIGHNNTAIAFTRIPIFSIGIYLSYLLSKGKEDINNYIIVMISIITIILNEIFINTLNTSFPEYRNKIIWDLGFYWIPFILITPGIIISITILFNYLDKKIPCILSSLKFLGTISLEIYLFHVNKEIVLAIKNVSPNHTVFFILMMILSVFGGYLVHKSISKIFK